jgi:hypothetical protein
MDHWIIKQALFEQHRDQLLQEAARERLLRQARDHQIEKKYTPRKEGNAVLKRRLAIGLAMLILAALWAIQIALAAGLGGGAGQYLVM